MPTGLRKLNNTEALLSNAIALLVAWGNSGTSGEVDEDLMDHLRGCGRGCQLDVYAKIFYDLRHSALGASIQGDMAVFVPSEGRFVVARRRGEAALVHALRQKVQLGPSRWRVDLHAVEATRLREKEWCCEGYFAQVYGFEEMALDAGYGSVHKFLQDARNSYDVTTMRAVRQFREEARLFDERYEPPANVLRAEHLATMALRAARTLAGQENGGRLSRTTFFLAGTESYTAAGNLLDSDPGAAGTFGTHVSFVGSALWSTKDELIELLCDEGADVIDYGLTTGTEELAAWFGSSERIDELEDRNYACLIPDNYPAQEFFSHRGVGQRVITRCVWDDVCYRESVVVGFLASGASSFLEWAGRGDHSVYRKVREEVDNGRGGTSRYVVRSARATGPGGNLYQIGVDPELVRRSTREVPAPAPAAEPTTLDEDLDEDMEEVNPLRGADPPKWAERKRSYRALTKIFNANPKLISDPPPAYEERCAIAKRLCEPNPSTAPDDVRLRERAFQWGDDQWTKWHDANDSSSEEEDEEDGDPFAEHNVPPATKSNRQRLKELYKLKFKVEPPTRGTSESKMFPGDFLDWMRHKIVNG